MSRQRKKYGLPAVERIELSERRFSLRALLAVAGIAAALVVLGLAIRGLLGAGNGWREIESDGSRGIHCGDDFTFMAEVHGAAELKRLSVAWSEATVKAQALFSVDVVDGQSPNLACLNARPNEDVAVDPALYAALKSAAAAGRYLYLGPVYELQRSLCACQDDSETAGFDPLRDGDARDFCAEAAAFARDPDSVNLAFPAENTVRLNLSDACAAFLKENGCAGMLDFGWMRNAYVIDCLMDAAEAAGLGRGYIASRDGFVRTRNCDGESVALGLWELRENGPRRTGRLGCGGTMSAAVLRAFPLEAGERGYYVYRDGDTRAPFADPADGLPRAALPCLAGASRETGCGALAAKLAPAYIVGAFDPAAGEDFALIWPGDDGWAASGGDFTLLPG